MPIWLCGRNGNNKWKKYRDGKGYVFVDYEKALDRVNHEYLLMLKGVGEDGKDRIVYKLYWNQKAAVRVGGDRSV